MNRIRAYGQSYVAAADWLNPILTKAVKNKIDYTRQNSLESWLKDQNEDKALAYIQSLDSPSFKIVIENFKRKNLQGKNTQRHLTTLDKAMPYEYTNDGGDAITDSPGTSTTPSNSPLLNNRYLRDKLRGKRS